MNSTITPNTAISNSKAPSPNYKKPKRMMSPLSVTGYTSLGAGALAAITGCKKVKIPMRMTLHKTFAIIGGLCALAHVAVIRNMRNAYKKK